MLFKSSCIRDEYGVSKTLMANHVVLSDINSLVRLFWPSISRSAIATTNGATAVTTRACGLRSSKIFRCTTREVYAPPRMPDQDIVG